MKPLTDRITPDMYKPVEYKCASPYCGNPTTAPGFCDSCLAQQSRMTLALREYHQKQRAEKRAS